MTRPPITELPPLTEFRRELLSIAAVTPFPHLTSPGRQQMFAHSHMAQKITCSGMTEQYLQTGVAAEFGKFTFSVSMPVDSKILKIFYRYPEQDSVGGIKLNPETVLVYEDKETKQLGCLTLPNYFSYHNYFGFPYQPGPAAHRLAERAEMRAGDILLDTPGKTATGNYMFGVQLNTILLSDEASAEDGLKFRRKALEKFKFKRYEVRVAEWGSSRFAINIGGDINNPKIFQDIGEEVRPDGLLMAFRTYDDQFAPVEQNINAVRQIDYAHDLKLYANGPGGKIVDIRVTTNYDFSQAGSNLDHQLKKYVDAKQSFYSDILRHYLEAKRNNPAIQVTPQYHTLLVKAMVETNYRNKNLSKVYRKVPIDHFRVEFVVEYEVTPSIGFKFTDIFGG